MNREPERSGPRPRSAPAHLASLINGRELKSLAWAVRRARKFGDGYAQNVRSAERALAKIREAAVSDHGSQSAES